MRELKWTGLPAEDLDAFADAWVIMRQKARKKALAEHPDDDAAAKAAQSGYEGSLISGLCAMLIERGCPVDECAEWAKRIVTRAIMKQDDGSPQGSGAPPKVH